MDLDWQVIATISAPLIALVAGAVIERAVASRPKLLTYLGHVSSHRFQQQDGSVGEVYTHSVVLRNSGRAPVKNVSLAHPYLPNFNVYPDVQHEVHELPGGGREILIPTLVPSEQVTISYLYFPPVTWNQVNGQVKSDNGFAKVIQVLPTQQYPRWFNLLALALMVLGGVVVLYALYSGFIYLVMGNAA